MRSPGLLFAFAVVTILSAIPGYSQNARRMPVPARVQKVRWSLTSGGPAALATVLQTYGCRLSAAQLERLCSAEGTKATLAGLENAARSARFKAKSVRTDAAGLARQPLPAVAEWQDGEFRVFITTRAAQVEVFDPATGARVWLSSELLVGWTGGLLLVHPGSV